MREPGGGDGKERTSTAPTLPATPGARPEARPQEPDAAAMLGRGSLVGRYVVRDLLGEGGLGVVYRAHDPELDRTVALKLVRVTRSLAPLDGEAHARLLREARAMARLAHPNVVAVHDAGMAAGGVFVAMELVDGLTLRAWLQGSRSRAEILAVFGAAGRGLAAAHGAGIVHRDFKPDNVMVGDDGRARVLDFGLARAAEAWIEPGPGHAETEPAMTITRSGAVLGTPAYMAPEQHRAGVVDERTDVFSFCVSLYEALCGEHPFSGENADALAQAVVGGARREPPTDARLPRALRALLARGLASDPADRYPTMDLLLADLDRLRRPRTWRYAAIAGTLVAAAAVSGLALGAFSERDETCPPGARALAGVWDTAARERLESALLATAHPQPRQAFAGLAAGVDRYADGWAALRERTCRAAKREPRPGPALEQRTRCLDRALARLEVFLANVTEESSTQAIDTAIEGVFELTSPGECLDAATPPQPPAPDVRARIEAVQARLDEVEAQVLGGRYDVALRLVRAAAEDAVGIDYPPLLAEALFSRGRLEAETGASADAERTLRAAAEAAIRARDDVGAARSWIALVHTVGYTLDNGPEGEKLGGVAAATLERAGDPPSLRAALESHLASLAYARGDYDRSEQHDRRALALREQTLGPDHPAVAASLTNLGSTLRARGRHAEAIEVLERSLSIRERALGPDHPKIAPVLTNLGNALKGAGEVAAAAERYQRALHIIESRLGQTSARLLSVLIGLGGAHRVLGELDAAEAAYARALAIATRARGTDHPTLVPIINNLGSLAVTAGRLDDAQAHYGRALALLEASHGADHPNVAAVLNNLGSVHLARGELGAAAEVLRRSVAIRERSLGADHPLLAGSLFTLGVTLAGAGQRAEARRQLERALAIRRAKGLEPTAVAEVELALARIAWSDPRRRQEARRLAERARAAYAAAGSPALAEVEAWLAHPTGFTATD